MSGDIVHEKLDSLSRCLARIEAKIPADAEVLRRDPDLQDILVLNLQRAVQVCVDLAGHLSAQAGEAPPRTMAESFDRLARSGKIAPEVALRMKKAVAFRNIAVHAYQDLDWDIVYSIVTRHLDDFKTFARALTEDY